MGITKKEDMEKKYIKYIFYMFGKINWRLLLYDHW